MHEVKSSTISHVSHDPAKNELTVRFHNGSTYSYPEVSADEYAALLTAPSVGKHFGEHIRPKKKAIKHGLN